MASVPFQSLIVAKSKAATDAIEQGGVKPPRYEANRIRKTMQARLIAQEYVRNGMMFVEAVKTVTGNKFVRGNNILKSLGNYTDVFMDELSRITRKTDIDRDKALAILWAMFNTSILDFLDDNGDVLSIAELRKLPRVMQLMLTEVDVTTERSPVVDATGKTMVDDNGSPYLKTKQRVRLKLPEKMVAIQQLAQLMRWVGPANAPLIQVNIGRLMSDADARSKRVTEVYDAVPLDTDD